MATIPHGPAKMSTNAAGRAFLLKRILHNALARIGLMMILAILLVSLLGPILLRFDPLRIDLHARFIPPLVDGHLFGTDALGRDIAARLFAAGRISLLVAFAAMVMSMIFGSAIGILAAYHGRTIGAVLMRFVDSFLCFPSIFLLLTLSAFIQPNPITITLLIAATSWMEIARIVAAEVRSLKEREFVLAALMAGQGGIWIMTRELAPNVMGPILVAASLTVARAILAEAYISFLGYGIQPPAPSWGNMLNGAQQYLATAPWMAIFPGLMITLAVTGFNFLGDGVRQVLDVKGNKR